MTTLTPTASALRPRRSRRSLRALLAALLRHPRAEETPDVTPVPTEEEAALGQRGPYLPGGLPFTF